MKIWKIISKPTKSKNLTSKDILGILLSNRGFSKKGDVYQFLTSTLDKYTLKDIGIEKTDFLKFEKRLSSAIEISQQIVIFGDYDVDGICASAILWEAIYTKTKKVIPYIPDRVDEGYGLSIRGIENVLESYPETKLIITVDNGIVAYDAIDFANSKGIDVIVTDHHVKGKKETNAFCTLHTTNLCGAGIAWFLIKELGFLEEEKVLEKLSLATLATVADLVPLIGANRAIVKEGLAILRKTKRSGIIELLKEAKIELESVDTYTIGHVIAPRLNATGRIQSAMNALRLLCTTNLGKAKTLANMLGTVNRSRQDMTMESVDHAKLMAMQSSNTRVTIVSDKSYNQGVIGLIASQLVESYYRPSFVISIGPEISKGSARSIAGVNIIELLRSIGDTLLEAGGHPMAAGFSLQTSKLDEFVEVLSKKSETVVKESLLKRYLTIDMELSFDNLSYDLLDEITKLEPFGMGNYEPVFATRGIEVIEVRKIGREQNHLKLKLKNASKTLDAVAFKFADKIDLETGDFIDVAYILDENKWDGKISLQLKIRDIKPKD